MADHDAGAADGAAEAPPRSEGSIRASFERLIAAGKELAEAELAWARLKGLSIVAIVWRMLLFASVGLACLIVGVALLLVAGIVALAPVTGLLAAVLTIAALSLIASVLLGIQARRTLERIFDEDAGKNGDGA